MLLQKLLPIGSARRKWIRQWLLDVAPPVHLARNFRKIDGFPEEVDLEADEIADTYPGRLEVARKCVVPWLDRARALSGARILEIGSGTGASTIALAEQGSQVTAVDVCEKSLMSAEERCKKLDLKIEFIVANATEVPRLLSGRKFDFIIFYASLEHMTHGERIDAIRGSWDMLAKGDFWCVTGTPNRLWPYDYHTSYLPFYFWLPDDLAFAYARRSARKNFRELYDEVTVEKMFHFLRRGRGLSYHEFDLAIGPLASLEIVSCMGIAAREMKVFNKWRSKFTSSYACESLLNRFAPDVHPGFFRKSLDLILRK